MIDLWQVPGLIGVAFEVITQKLWMWNLPQLDQIGGSAKGLVCIVTGPTSGIGRETAAALVRRQAEGDLTPLLRESSLGFDIQPAKAHQAVRDWPAIKTCLVLSITCFTAPVFLACRSLERGNKLKAELDADARQHGVTQPFTEVLELDLASLESVRSFAEGWRKRGRPLHVLVNNAGMWGVGAGRALSPDGVELHMATNYLGQWLLTLLLLPSMRAAGTQERPARIVNVSSKLHTLGRLDPSNPQDPRGFSAFKAYCRAKLAQTMWTAELRRRLRDEGRVLAVAVHPGEALTSVTRSTPAWVQQAYRALWVILLTASQGARTSVYAATSPDILQHQHDLAKCYYGSNCRPEQPCKQALDPKQARELWTWSLKESQLPARLNLQPLNGNTNGVATGQNKLA